MIFFAMKRWIHEIHNLMLGPKMLAWASQKIFRARIARESHGRILWLGFELLTQPALRLADLVLKSLEADVICYNAVISACEGSVTALTATVLQGVVRCVEEAARSKWWCKGWPSPGLSENGGSTIDNLRCPLQGKITNTSWSLETSQFFNETR